MPSLEITSSESPKDLQAFVKALSPVFAECIGKPEGVSILCSGAKARFRMDDGERGGVC